MRVHTSLNTNGFWDPSHSKFDWNLQKKHLDEAKRWVVQCRNRGTSPLDSCGERGDLFFLLQSNPWLLAWGAD